MKTSSLVRSSSVLVSLALVLGACAKDTDAPSDSTSSVVAASPDSVAPTSTSDPNVIVAENPAITQLKLTSGGGFTTWQYNVSTLPIAWINGDSLYRGVPNETMNPLVSKATQQAFNRPAREKLTELLAGAGFVGEPLDFGAPGITDMPTTTLEFALDGKSYRHDAYALEAGPEVSADLTDEQQKNRANLTSLIEMVRDPAKSYGAENVGAPTDLSAKRWIPIRGKSTLPGRMLRSRCLHLPTTLFAERLRVSKPPVSRQQFRCLTHRRRRRRQRPLRSCLRREKMWRTWCWSRHSPGSMRAPQCPKRDPGPIGDARRNSVGNGSIGAPLPVRRSPTPNSENRSMTLTLRFCDVAMTSALSACSCRPT
jgi:hypothetical protein